MAKKQVQLRLEEELHQSIKERANATQLSVNEWINRAITYSLLVKGVKYTETTTRKVEF